MSTLKCPICKQVDKSQIYKSWVFGQYEVKRYKCANCEQFYNIYFVEGRVKYTIPKEGS